MAEKETTPLMLEEVVTSLIVVPATIQLQTSVTMILLMVALVLIRLMTSIIALPLVLLPSMNLVAQPLCLAPLFEM